MSFTSTRRRLLTCTTSVAVLTALVLAGCTAPKQSVPHASQSNSAQSTQSAQPVVNARPLIDFARGAGAFPLDTETMPAALDEFVKSLGDGYHARVQLGRSAQPVIAVDDKYPRLKSLVVDLTDGQIKPDYRPSTFKAYGRLKAGVLHAKYLSYTAMPLRYVDGSTSLRITAEDVTLALLRGRGEQGALVMTDAKNGRVDFSVAINDLRSMLLASARAAGSGAGYSARDITLRMFSDSSRSLSCEMRVRGYWLLLPTSFKITGRIDIDDDFNAHISNVGCTGDDVGGALFAGFIDGALKKYNNRVMPLARFPAGRIKIRDLKIDADDMLTIYVEFSS